MDVSAPTEGEFILPLPPCPRQVLRGPMLPAHRDERDPLYSVCQFQFQSLLETSQWPTKKQCFTSFLGIP